MEHRAILITGAPGSGYQAIGLAAAGILSVPCYDQTLLTAAVRRGGPPQQMWRQLDEAAANRLMRTLYTGEHPAPPTGVEPQLIWGLAKAAARRGPCIAALPEAPGGGKAFALHIHIHGRSGGRLPAGCGIALNRDLLGEAACIRLAVSACTFTTEAGPCFVNEA